MLAHFKAPSTQNVSDGIEEAVRQVLQLGGASPADVSCVSIGTTAFINAVLEADPKRLAKVAVIRLCGPYTQQCPPFIDFPKRLKVLIEGHVGYIDGGFESLCCASYRNAARCADSTSVIQLTGVKSDL